MEKLRLKRRDDTTVVTSQIERVTVSEEIDCFFERSIKSLQEKFNILYQHIIPFKAARYSPAPMGLDSRLRAHLSEHELPLYDHQASALYLLLKRNNVLLSTKTASGKSLVFMSFSIDKLLKCPESKVMVLYPTRALIEDQLERWHQYTEKFGFKTGYLHGQVGREDRLKVLETCQIVLCTPDILHYWLMPSLYLKVVANWLSAINFIIIDEAHTFSGVFGTNVSYLLKRIERFAKTVQYFASTATIADAAHFLAQLTGKNFIEVGRPEDGSPTYRKEIFFVKPKDRTAIVTLLTDVIASNTKFMYFRNSRQGIEQSLADLLQGDYGAAILPQINDGFVCTYRGGYESKDRTAIMDSLRLGKLKGVLCTSALEVGLDIGDVDLVIIDDVSPNINAFWQRVGRAGRKGPALVIQILSEGSLVEPETYLTSPLLTPSLYPQLEFFKEWHSHCALQEQIMFKKRAAMVQKLQFRHSFRNMGATFKLGLELNLDLNLGDVDYEQYLNEAYPGAIYRYMGRPHRVGWRNNDFIKCYRSADIFVSAEEIRFSLLSQDHISDGFSSYLTRAQTVKAIIGFTQFGRSYFYTRKSSWCKKPIFKLYDSTALVVKVAEKNQPSQEQLGELIKIFAALAGFDKNDIIYHLDHDKSLLIIQAIIPDTGLTEQVLWPAKDILLGLLNRNLAAENIESDKDARFYLRSHQIDPVMANVVKGANYGFFVDEKAGKYLFLPVKGINAQGYYEVVTGIYANRLINSKYFRLVYEQPSSAIVDIMLNGYGNFVESEFEIATDSIMPDASVLGQHNGTEHCLVEISTEKIGLLQVD
jgi:superfamily II DNA/RNA helicase